jgi:hypothetical protein
MRTCLKVALLCGLFACSQSGGNKHDGAPDTRATDIDGQGGASLDVASESGVPSNGGEAGADWLESTCRTEKIAFSQETGCRNDDAVEFCIPANDQVAEAQVKAIEPTLACNQSAGGRAQCGTSERLCMLSISSQECPWGDPMPDALWRSVCQLAALDVVRNIVPTYYE